MGEVNPYERQHRFSKAVKMVDKIEELNLTIEYLESMKLDDILQFSHDNGFRHPSETTWAIVKELYRKRKQQPFQ
jgi:hypothetical protein